MTIKDGLQMHMVNNRNGQKILLYWDSKTKVYPGKKYIKVVQENVLSLKKTLNTLKKVIYFGYNAYCPFLEVMFLQVTIIFNGLDIVFKIRRCMEQDW